MIIYVDIDNTICKTEGMDYENATPYRERIDKINALFHQGHNIVYWTARGSGSGKDWEALTKKQLNMWDAYYNELKMEKPIYDLFIDDKNLSTNDFFEI